jgi:hypothetical protein
MSLPRVAVVCSAHGFGHLTRQLAVGAELRRRGVEPVFFTAAPASVVEEDLPGARRVEIAVDVGIVQRDSLTEDPDATVGRLEQRCSDAAIDALAERLRAFDRVVIDIAPPALEAARRARVPAVAVGNFDWAWIYAHYPPLRGWSERFHEWQAGSDALALSPGPGLSGFATVTDVGLLARWRPPVRVTAGRSVVVCFGGFGLAGMEALLPRIPGVEWILAPPMPRLRRDDCRYVDGVPFPSLVSGADAVLTKPGYGIYGECAAAGTPIVWLDRGAFPEAPSIEAAMRARGDVKVPEVTPAAISDAVRTVLDRPRPSRIDAPAAGHVVERVLAGREPAA